MYIHFLFACLLIVYTRIYLPIVSFRGNFAVCDAKAVFGTWHHNIGKCWGPYKADNRATVGIYASSHRPLTLSSLILGLAPGDPHSSSRTHAHGPISTLAFLDTRAHPKRGSTLGLCNLHHRFTKVQNWGIYCLNPAGGLVWVPGFGMAQHPCRALDLRGMVGGSKSPVAPPNGICWWSEM